MSDMGDDFRAFREFKRERKNEEQPKRMDHATRRLESLGWQVFRIDHTLLKVFSPSGDRFNFWPWTGYWAGPTQGRGLENLVKAGK